MKKSILIIGFASLSMLACDENTKNAETEGISTDLINNPISASSAEDGTENLPAFEFEEDVIDFGAISQGEKVKKQYKFKNVGKANLIISDAKGSCGCTVPLWPKQPIRPGQEGIIEVVFDSNGKKGRQSKTITLIANTIPNTKVLALKGDVLTPNEIK